MFYLSHAIAYGSDITSCNKIDKPQEVVYRDKYIYLRTLKTHHPDKIPYLTNPQNGSEIIVIAYHNLTSL